jgi:hypothetical protein
MHMNKNFNTLSLYNINKKKNASKKDNSELVLLLYVIAHTFNLLMYLCQFYYFLYMEAHKNTS